MANGTDSLRMREPADLVGRWTVTVGTRACTVSLLPTRVDAANAWQLTDAGGCLAPLMPGAATWRPVPEGIAIATIDGKTLLVLTATGPGLRGEATTTAGQHATITPAGRR